MAKEASEKMCDLAYNEKINEIQKEIDNKVEFLVNKYIPQSIIEVVSIYKTYFYTRNLASVTTNNDRGYNENYIYGTLSFEIPDSCNDIHVTKEEYAPIRELSDKKVAIEKERKDFKNKILNALVQLRTYKNVEKELPEAMKFLPAKQENNLPAPIYKGLNDLIGQIKCK